jgi:hypothetical protein
MSVAESHSTAQTLAVVLWMAAPPLLTSRLPRFRIPVGAALFWGIGALYYTFVSPPDRFTPPLFGWPYPVLLSGFIYALLIKRIQDKLRRASGPERPTWKA